MSAAIVVSKIVVTWLITDFISGFVHWLEDSYGHPHLPCISSSLRASTAGIMSTGRTRYCVLTDFLNPILDSCRFWRALEFVVLKVFRLEKRDDEALLALVLAEEPGFLEGAS